MKTMNQWHKSGKDLDKFLQIGDIVDETMKMYFLEVLPPACWSSNCIQIGSPESHNPNTGKPEFMTLESIDGEIWQYTGIKTTPRGNRCLYIE